MSLGLFVNFTIWVTSLCAAWLDHGETHAAFKLSSGRERGRKRIKLYLLWIVPVLSFIALPVTWLESRASERQIIALQPKPLKDRVMIWLGGLDPSVMLAAKQGQRVFEVSMTEAQKSDLQHLCAEDRKAQYIREQQVGTTRLGGGLGRDTNARFTITDEVLK